MAAESYTVAEILRLQADSRGRHPLLVCDADRLSYAEAERRSAKLARGLIALGAGKGTHVGLLYPNGAEFVVAMLAAARIGAVVVPFTTFATAPEMADQLVHSDVAILLAAASHRGNDFRKRLADIDHTAIPVLRHVLIDSDRRPPSTRRYSRRWKTTSTDRIRWRSSTRRVRPARPRGWCTPTPPCSDIRKISTRSAA